ncbi:MAG: CopG family transcriptional regulator [Candidatus Pacearchaeota archaeon]
MKKKKAKEIQVKYGTISLPLPLIEKVKKKIKGTGMPSVSAYIAFILRQILSEEDGTQISNRLKKLGYI